MTLIAYDNTRLSRATLALIAQATSIIAEYQTQGYTLNLRALFYQFVSRAQLPNTHRAYKTLGEAVKKGRRCGLISWDAIEDRTRNLVARQHWTDPREVIEAANAIDMWANQPCRLECWVEKDALSGIIEPVCRRFDVPFFASRGNSSDSEMQAAGHGRFLAAIERGQRPIILHLADHDPNGLDMTRDLRARLSKFARHPVEVRRIGLNIDQVERYRPPPNYAKESDSRFKAYAATYGQSCWELDALAPSVIADLVESATLDVIEPGLWAQRLAEEDAGRETGDAGGLGMTRAYHRRRAYPQPHLQKAKQANAMRRMAEAFDRREAERRLTEQTHSEPEGDQ